MLLHLRIFNQNAIEKVTIKRQSYMDDPGQCLNGGDIKQLICLGNLKTKQLTITLFNEALIKG